MWGQWSQWSECSTVELSTVNQLHSVCAVTARQREARRSEQTVSLRPRRHSVRSQERADRISQLGEEFMTE